MICDYRNGQCLHCGHTAPQMPFFRNCPSLISREKLSAVPQPCPAGSELKRLLSGFPFFITTSENCLCNARARQMDEWTCDENERRTGEIVSWMRDEASRRGLPFLDVAARLLVRRAIANARNAEARRAKEAEAAAAEGPAA